MLMLHLMLVVDMLCAKLIRCHQTELIRAATLACTGRPWLSLSVGSLMRITKEGRLRACGYPGPVSGGNLESRLCYWDPVPDWDKIYGPCDGRLPCDGWCVWRTRGYPRHDF